MLERCLVKVERVTIAGQTDEIQGALKTDARQDDGYVGRFALGPDERKRVVLTSREIRDPRMPKPHMIDCETAGLRVDRGSSVTVELIAISEIGGPDRLRVRLSVDSKYQLTHETLPIN